MCVNYNALSDGSHIDIFSKFVQGVGELRGSIFSQFHFYEKIFYMDFIQQNVDDVSLHHRKDINYTIYNYVCLHNL